MPDTPHNGLPVSGYQPQSEKNVELVNHFKELEERLLREIDVMRDTMRAHRFDQRWLSIAQTHFQQGFMALNRSVFQPSRIRLPGDEKPIED
jgi:hypothetical protein